MQFKACIKSTMLAILVEHTGFCHETIAEFDGKYFLQVFQGFNKVLFWPARGATWKVSACHQRPAACKKNPEKVCQLLRKWGKCCDC